MRSRAGRRFSNIAVAAFTGAAGLLFAQTSPSIDVRSELADIRDVEYRLTAAVVSGVPVVFAEQPSPSIRFHSGGVISGNTGVNQYFARIKVAADGAISIDSPGFALTRLTADPQRMALEARFLNTLQATRFIRVERDGVVFETEDRITRLQFARTNGDLVISEILNMDWVLARLTNSGMDVAIPSGVAITLRFQDAGRLAGRSAVNNYGGGFTAMADGKIMIQIMAATQILGPPELTSFDSAYFDALSRVRAIHVKPEQIILEGEGVSMTFAVRNPRGATSGVRRGRDR